MEPRHRNTDPVVTLAANVWLQRAQRVNPPINNVFGGVHRLIHRRLSTRAGWCKHNPVAVINTNIPVAPASAVACQRQQSLARCIDLAGVGNIETQTPASARHVGDRNARFSATHSAPDPVLKRLKPRLFKLSRIRFEQYMASASQIESEVDRRRRQILGDL